MPKLHIINYKPYEYNLLQEKLDQLGKDGYCCKDLTRLSLFKQVHHPVFYKIDFFQRGKRNDKELTRREKFYSQYLDHGCQHIHQKYGLQVFVNDQDDPKEPRHKNISTYNSLKEKTKYFLYFMVSICISTFLLYSYLPQININTFPTYGKLIAFVGFVFAGCTFIYRTFLNFYNTHAFLNGKEIKISVLKLERKIYHCLFIISLVLCCGGLVEDIFNSQNLTQVQPTTLQLVDFNKESSTVVQNTLTKGFLCHTSTYLESSQNQDVLLHKEYQFHSENKAKKYFDDFKTNPNDFSIDSIKTDGNILYGYTNNHLTTMIILSQDKIEFISTSFSLTDKDVQTIKNQF